MQLEELLKYFEELPGHYSVQTKVRMLEAYGAIRLAKANEALAAAISRIATTPIAVKTETILSGTVSANVKDVK